MSTIYLKVKGLAGSEILQVSKEAIELANKVGVSVEFDFNGVVCVARPNESAESLAKNWEQEVSSKKKYKFASSEEVNTVEKPEIDWDGISNQTRKYEYNSDAAEFLKNQFKILQNSLNPEPSSKKEEGWEILSYINPYVITDIKDGNIVKPNIYATLRDYPINSVLRKSDNIVFTVGDETTIGVIKRFEVSEELMYWWNEHTWYYLSQAIKAPTNTVEDSPFVWTDELVEDYSTKKALDFSFNTPTEARTNIERFKKSKTSNQ